MEEEYACEPALSEDMWHDVRQEVSRENEKQQSLQQQVADHTPQPPKHLGIWQAAIGDWREPDKQEQSSWGSIDQQEPEQPELKE